MTAWQFAFFATLFMCVLHMHYIARAETKSWAPEVMKYFAVLVSLGYDLTLAALVAIAAAFIFHFV